MIQHRIIVDLASPPTVVANESHQALYLDGEMSTWLSVDPCQGEDPRWALLAAEYLDALSDRARELADWHRARATTGGD